MEIERYDLVQKREGLNPNFSNNVEILPPSSKTYMLEQTPDESQKVQNLRILGKMMLNGRYAHAHHGVVQRLLSQLSMRGFNDPEKKGEGTLFLPVARAGIPLVRELPKRFP